MLTGLITSVLISIWGLVILYGFFPLQKWKFRQFRGPKPLWLIGNLPEMVAMGQHKAYQHWARMFGPTFLVWLGAFPVVITEDPATAHKITSKLFSRHPVPLLEQGEEAKLNDMSIVFARGDLWKSFRFAWQPMFHHSSLEAFVSLMRGKAERLVHVLDKEAKQSTPVDIVTTFNEMTMEVVGETAYGVDFNILPRDDKNPLNNSDGHFTNADQTTESASLEAETRQLVSAMKSFFKGTAQMGSTAIAFMLMFPFTAPFIRWVVNTFPSADYSAVMASRRLIRDVSARMLQRARNTRQLRASDTHNASNNPSGEKINRGTGAQPGSFIYQLMRAMNKVTSKPFSDFEIIANSFFFLVSGNETTSTALTMAAWLLATNPDKEAKVLQEVDKYGRNLFVTYDDLNKFPYIDAVIKETLRLYPPVHIATREADREMQVGNYTIPAGTSLQVSIYGMHRSPIYWANPDSFIPERFLPGSPEGQSDVMDAYMPFGDGPRGCIGSAYALQEVKITLVALYQRFTMRVAGNKVGEPKIRTTITLAPEGPIMIDVTARK